MFVFASVSAARAALALAALVGFAGCTASPTVRGFAGEAGMLSL